MTMTTTSCRWVAVAEAMPVFLTADLVVVVEAASRSSIHQTNQCGIDAQQNSTLSKRVWHLLPGG